MVNKKNLITAMTIGFGTIILHYIYRPLLPIDETRYASVAWEMWLNHDWLVPYMNGLPYSHKPPLLFWIINITWNISGVSEWGVRLIIPMIALSNFYLTYQLAKLIYKNNFEAVNYSPLILVNIMGWYLYIPFLYFDQLLTVFILANIYFSWCYAETNKKTYYIFAGISMGLAMLTKGPVTLVYLLPVFISYPCWRKSNMICCSDWFKGCIANFSIGTGIILCWAVPAAINGGPDYAKEIFIWQSFNRINKSFSHAKPFYYYTLLLPVLLSPTCFSFALWRVKKWLPLSKEDKFFFYNIPSTFLLLSCISGKQIHYLLPLFPLLSIYLASKLKLEHFKIEPILISLLLLLALTCFTSSYWQSFFFPHIKLLNNRFWGFIPLLLAILISVPNLRRKFNLLFISFPLGFSSLLPTFSPLLNQAYDISQLSKLIYKFQEKGEVVSYIGKYHNQFQFQGRLKKSLTILNQNNLKYHIEKYEDALVIMKLHHLNDFILKKSVYIQPFRGKFLVLINKHYLNNEKYF